MKKVRKTLSTSRRPVTGHFARSDAGGLAIFGLFIILALALVSAAAVDMSRYEQERTRLQETTDRAVLAAASLRQTRSVEQVIRDYLAVEGLEELITDIQAEEGINFRSARVTASAEMPTLMMRLLGVDALDLRVISAAEERVPNLEISLVLDLSGSMNSFNRLANLRVAAREFIETVFAGAEGGAVSMSIIPYTGNVNAGEALLSHFQVDYRNRFSHCVDFDARHFTTTALPPHETLQGAGHGIPWEAPRFNSLFRVTNPLHAGFYDCPIAPGNTGVQIVPFSTDPDFLIARVNSMRALGATSIDIGMRWGVAMVDPSLQPVVNGLINDGAVNARLAGRPSAYDDAETLKIIVLMTDGENYEERRLRPEVKAGLTNIFFYTDDHDDYTDVRPQTLANYSLFDANRNEYWHRHNNQWYPYPRGATEQETCTQVCRRYHDNGTCQQWRDECTTTWNLDGVRQLDWTELFHRASMYWVAREIIAPATHHNGPPVQQNNFAHNLTMSWQDVVPTWVKDQRLQQVCNAARNAGITVFSVAFEADPGGLNGLRNCATTPSHFFDVRGVQISEAFRAIANNIRRLRLIE